MSSAVTEHRYCASCQVLFEQNERLRFEVKRNRAAFEKACLIAAGSLIAVVLSWMR
jgi:predicted nucleic acid-binding Zn ribbon protein